MKTLCTFAAFLPLFFSINAHAIYSNTASVFEINPAEFKTPKTIPFENRAACAADSKLPSQSAFLIVDSYNAGKLIDSWLKATSADQTFDMSVDQALKFFRLSLTQTWMTVTQELLNGRLPLLQATPDSDLEPKYAQALAECGQRFPCAAMDEYLGSILQQWKTLPEGTDSAYPSFLELDQFAKRPELLKGRMHPQSSCLYVKRFSEFQANWGHDRPDQALLQKVALAALAEKDLFTTCFDESDTLSSRRFMLEVDVSEVQKRAWKKHGFDFWYSVKLYFSYAWRHPELMLDSSHPMTQLFKNLAIEQMMQLVSTSCQSIDRPECSQSQASLEIFNSLGKMGIPTEVDKPLPDRPEQLLISKQMETHREDSAILPDNQESDQWIKGYQERIMQRRGLMKQRLLLAVSQFELLSSSMTSDRISKELAKLKTDMSLDPVLYQKMQVLCSEIDVAIRPDVNLLEKRFETTLQSGKFKRLVESSTDQQLTSMIGFYQSIAKTTFPICEQIRVEKLWKNDTAVATESYAAWYRDLSGTWAAPVPQPDGTTAAPDFSGMGAVFNKMTSSPNVFLSQEKISQDGEKESTVVCTDASDCVRMLLKSMVDLYAVSSWSDALMPMNEWIQSPNLANPWAASTACKVYDPWFATKQSLVSLVTDLVSTTVVGITGVPAYLAASARPREVTGFSIEPKGDEMFMKPIKKGPGVDLTLGVDLGPWGIPCAAMFSPTSTMPNVNGFYTITAIRGQVCSGKNNNKLVVNDASSPGENQKHTYSGCAMCYLNPYSVLQSGAALASYSVPGLRIAAGVIFSGVSFAKRMNNPVDVPHRFKVDIDEVSNTFEKYSFIPKRCVHRLSKGRSCQHVTFTKSEREAAKKNASTQTASPAPGLVTPEE